MPIQVTKQLNLAKSATGENRLVKDLDELLAGHFFAGFEVSEGAVN